MPSRGEGDEYLSSQRRRFIQRSRLDIIACILSNSENGSRKTRLIYQCNLSVSQFNKYATCLIEGRLLKTRTDKKRGFMTYSITRKGSQFLVDYQKIRGVLEEMGL